MMASGFIRDPKASDERFPEPEAAGGERKASLDARDPVEEIKRRATSMTSVLEAIARRSAPCDHWGINE
jgi:hypothetical protein